MSLAARPVRGKSPEAYRPGPQDDQERVRELMATHALPGDGALGCYRIADSSPYSDVARALECTVFAEAFGNDPEVMAEAYGPYERHSTFLLLVDRKQQLAAGTMRIIMAHDGGGLKTLDNIEDEPLRLSAAKAMAVHGIDDPSKCWDLGTLAVMPNYRGQSAEQAVSISLLGVMYQQMGRDGIDHGVAILGERVYRWLTRVLGVPFHPILGSPPFDYLGSLNSRAAHVYRPDFAPALEAHMRGLSPEVLRMLEPQLTRLIYGQGLPPVVDVE